MAVPTVRRNGTDLYTEIGVSGISRQGGYLDDEILQEMKGSRRAKAIQSMMSNDATIGALLFCVKMLVRQVSWRIDPASEDNADQQAAEFVDGAMFHDMSTSWANTLADIVSFLPWGWSFHETVYKVRGGETDDPTRRSRFTDGKIGWRKWPIRSQETLDSWQFDEAGGVQAMLQRAAPDFGLRVIPIEKALLFQTEPNRGNPEGYSILRNAYRSWKMKSRIENIEGIGIERDLAGLPVAWVPPDYMAPEATAEKRAVFEVMKTLATSIRRDEEEGVVMPMMHDDKGNKLFDLTLLSTGGARQFNINETVNRYDHRILVSVLADFLLLGAEKVGSFALSSDKTELFAVALGAWLESIAGVINQHAIPRLLRLNGMQVSEPPKLCHGDIEVPDLADLAAYVAALVNVGAMTPTPELEAYLRETASLPAMPEQAT